MTSHEIESVVGVGAMVLAAAATKLDVSPWRIFGLAGIATIATVVLAIQVSGEPCGLLERMSAVDRFFEITIVSSLALYAAAALAGIVDGIRLGRGRPRQGDLASRGDSDGQRNRRGDPVLRVHGVDRPLPRLDGSSDDRSARRAGSDRRRGGRDEAQPCSAVRRRRAPSITSSGSSPSSAWSRTGRPHYPP